MVGIGFLSICVMVLLYLSVATTTGLKPLILLSLLAIGGFPVTILLILGLPFFPAGTKCGNDDSCTVAPGIAFCTVVCNGISFLAAVTSLVGSLNKLRLMGS